MFLLECKKVKERKTYKDKQYYNTKLDYLHEKILKDNRGIIRKERQFINIRVVNRDR